MPPRSPRPATIERQPPSGSDAASARTRSQPTQPMLRLQLGVLDAHDAVAVDARNGAEETCSSRQGDVDVDALGGARAQAAAPVDQRHHALEDRLERGPAERTWRQVTAGNLGRHRSVEVGARQPRIEQPVADLPAGESRKLDAELVGDVGVVGGQGQPESLPQESLGGRLQECCEVVEPDHRPVVRQGPVGERRPPGARCGCGPAAGERRTVEAERPVGHQAPGLEVAPVERLQRMLHEHLVTHRAGRDRCRAVEHVEQLAERDGRRSLGPGALVVSAVEEHQVLLGRKDRVEEELAVLAARIALAHSRAPSQNVVAVEVGVPRERLVVEAEQEHHPVRHRPHRHHRAHGQVPGAEVGPGGSAGEELGQQRR